MRAHFLAHSGCELARAALVKEYFYVEPPGGVMPPSKTKWEIFVEKFSSIPADTAFMDKHSVCMSLDGTVEEPGYKTKAKFQPEDGSVLTSEVKDLLSDVLILIKVTRVSDTPTDAEEEQYKGFLRVEAIGRTGLDGGFKGEGKCYLYIDSKNQNKMYWR